MAKMIEQIDLVISIGRGAMVVIVATVLISLASLAVAVHVWAKPCCFVNDACFDTEARP